MNNPFETIDRRLSNIESLLLKHNELPNSPKQNNLDELLTSKEAAKHLGVTLATLHRWKESGIVKSVRINTRIRYKVSDLDNALKSK